MDDIDDSIRYEGSSDDESGAEHENPKVLTNVSEMENFLVGGHSFRNLSIKRRLFLLPATLAPLSRIIMSIPNEQIWFSTNDDLSLLNRAKVYIENQTDKFNWWPLKPPTRLLQKHQVRVHWRCVKLQLKKNERPIC
jgi:hypothetical protein